MNWTAFGESFFYMFLVMLKKMLHWHIVSHWVGRTGALLIYTRSTAIVVVFCRKLPTIPQPGFSFVHFYNYVPLDQIISDSLNFFPSNAWVFFGRTWVLFLDGPEFPQIDIRFCQKWPKKHISWSFFSGISLIFPGNHVYPILYMRA